MGVTGVLAVAVALSITAGGAPSEGNPAAPAPERKPPLPKGCSSARVGELQTRSFEAPDQVLKPGEDLRAVIRTSCGDIALDLFEEDAPVNVNSFAFLARQGFYTGLPFHRVEKNSVIQSGDPNGKALDPPEGPGYELPDELARAHFDRYVYGVVGIANRGPDTGGSQFFIVVHDLEGARADDPEPAGYRPNYTIIGRVDRSSWDVLDRIAEADTKGGLDPVESVEPVHPVVIRAIDIREARRTRSAQ